jgi:hypothetical protein
MALRESPPVSKKEAEILHQVFDLLEEYRRLRVRKGDKPPFYTAENNETGQYLMYNADLVNNEHLKLALAKWVQW